MYVYEDEGTVTLKRLSQGEYENLLMDHRVMLASIGETAEQLEKIAYSEAVKSILDRVMVAGNTVRDVILEMERQKDEICQPELHVV